MSTFRTLGLNEHLLKSLEDLNFEKASPIQESAIPFILRSKQDLIALAQTGTGKTAAFGLPILNQIDTQSKQLQAIILCPTRELCMQTAKSIEIFATYMKGLNIAAIYGGEAMGKQKQALDRGAQIVVGTPGRVRDMIKRKFLSLEQCQWVVLDEADEMLDMGFKEELDAILDTTPEEKQTLLFSATMSRSVRDIAKKYMVNAQEIAVAQTNIGADTVTHEYYVVSQHDRFLALKRILHTLPDMYGIVFCRTKQETEEIANMLKENRYDAAPIHGDISQGMRTKIMDQFRKKRVQILVATDVAARGIDVDGLTHVINYNLPQETARYTHRSGRTGRAKKTGVAISIVTQRELRKIKELEKIVQKSFEYKKIPTGTDISKKQIFHFIDRMIEQNVDQHSHDHYLEEVTELLSHLSKEDLIKYFITHTFEAQFSSKDDTRDLNASPKSVHEKRSYNKRPYRGKQGRKNYSKNNSRLGAYKKSRGRKKY